MTEKSWDCVIEAVGLDPCKTGIRTQFVDGADTDFHTHPHTKLLRLSKRSTHARKPIQIAKGAVYYFLKHFVRKMSGLKCAFPCLYVRFSGKKPPKPKCSRLSRFISRCAPQYEYVKKKKRFRFFPMGGGGEDVLRAFSRICNRSHQCH